MRSSLLYLAGATAVAVAAVAWLDGEPQPSPRPMSAALAPAPAAPADLGSTGRSEVRASASAADRIAREAWPEAPRSHAWGVAVPPAAAPSARTHAVAAAASQPAAALPVLPYQWIGRIEDANGAQVLLLHQGGLRTVAAKRNDVLDGQWRVDAIEPAQLRLTWLPDGRSHTVSMRPL